MSTTAVTKSAVTQTVAVESRLTPSQAEKVATWRATGLKVVVRAMPDSRNVVAHLSHEGAMRGKVVVGPRGGTDLILPGVEGAETYFASMLLALAGAL